MDLKGLSLLSLLYCCRRRCRRQCKQTVSKIDVVVCSVTCVDDDNDDDEGKGRFLMRWTAVRVQAGMYRR